MTSGGTTRLTRDVDFPADGSAVWYYPGGTTAGGQDGMLLGVERSDGSQWLCMIAGQDGTMVKVFGPFEMPDGRHHFYGNGYIVCFDDPADWQEVKVSPVIDARWVPSRRVVVFYDFCSAAAYGREGLAWHKGPIVRDDLEVTDITEDRVTFRGYGWDDTKLQYVALDIDSGNVVEGRMLNG